MEVFRATMIAGSMNGASSILNISQPAISRSIALAEQSMGMKLFHRRKGKLVPTREAELLFAEVDRLHDVAMQVNRFADNLLERPSGHLSICASPSLALGFIPGVIAAYMRRAPDVHLRYRTALLSEIPHHLISRQIDLAITVLPIQDENLEVATLANGGMICVLPRGHPLTGRRRLSLRELSHHPLVSYDRGIPFGRLITQAFSRLNVSPRIAVEVPRAELALALVREGVGYALLDRFTISHLSLPDIDLRPIEEEIPITISLVRSRHREPNSHVDAFTDLLHEAAAADVNVKASPLWARGRSGQGGHER